LTKHHCCQTGSAGDTDHFADQVLAILILQVEQVFADQRWPRPVRDTPATQVVNERVEVTIVESRGGFVRNRFERRVGARLCEHVFDALDHRDGLVPGTVITCGRNANLGQ